MPASRYLGYHLASGLFSAPAPVSSSLSTDARVGNLNGDTVGSVNKVFLIGNLGGDAELRRTAAGTAVCNLSLATSEHWTNKAKQRQERTDWHRIVVWDRLAESLEQYLTKGKQICVEGQLQTRNWTDRNGKKRYTTEIYANRVTLLGGRSTEPSGLSPAARGVSTPPASAEQPSTLDSRL